MFEEVLSKNAKESLAILSKSRILEDAYMAGGTALALQIGHRYSYDFDFFTLKEFDEKILVQKIKKYISDFQLERTSWGTIMGYIKKTRFSLFFYNYPILFPFKKFLNIKIVDIKDIAAMKIAAISDRGTKRDFIDLFFIVSREKLLTFSESLELYNKKFKLLQQNKIHILKSLSYFEDADKDAMPKMIKEVEWLEVKDYFQKEIKSLNQILLR